MTKTFDLEKAIRNDGKCVTRDGRPARIVCTNVVDVGIQYPILALVMCDCDEYPKTYTKQGAFNVDEQSRLDLFNIPEKKKGWIAHKDYRPWENFYRNTTPIYYDKAELLKQIKNLREPETWIIQQIEWTEE